MGCEMKGGKSWKVAPFKYLIISKCTILTLFEQMVSSQNLKENLIGHFPLPYFVIMNHVHLFLRFKLFHEYVIWCDGSLYITNSGTNFKLGYIYIIDYEHAKFHIRENVLALEKCKGSLLPSFTKQSIMDTCICQFKRSLHKWLIAIYR